MSKQEKVIIWLHNTDILFTLKCDLNIKHLYKYFTSLKERTRAALSLFSHEYVVVYINIK